MAANKLTAGLHRRTHRLLPALVYTLLELTLIVLLLFNALLSYLAARFAAYFRLHPPCIFCSRIDHHLEGRGRGRGGGIASAARRGLLCDPHAAEVSKLGFCSDHRRLAEAVGMCGCCSSSLPSPPDRRGRQTVALLSVVEKEAIQGCSRCSCCDVEMENPELYPYLFLKLGKCPSETTTDSAAAAAKIARPLSAHKDVVGGDGGGGGGGGGDGRAWVSPPDPVPAGGGERVNDDLQRAVEESMGDIGLIRRIGPLKPLEDPQESHSSGEDEQIPSGETNCEVSIGSEICDREWLLVDQRRLQAADEGPVGLQKRDVLKGGESGTESADGSVAGEIAGGDVLTADQLKAALMAERRALSALYWELEEERNASAIAANQTMAMITRLQEEKAAVQMEALQYQRMMEEQSEFDQEALQMLNEILIKREKEKRELEKELDLLRKKVALCESKERRRLKRAEVNAKRKASSSSSSTEDCDDRSVDNGGTVTTSLASAGESPADLEEERLAIIDQLKSLAENSSENEEGDEGEFCSSRISGSLEGYEGCPRTMLGWRAKSLLPLFDAAAMESGANFSQGSDLRPGHEQTKHAILENAQAGELDAGFL